MCGIAGSLHLRSGSPEPDLLMAMIARLAHRGPDGNGVFVDGPCGLAHARLAIVDLVGGVQPMRSEDSALCVTFNGEIFNHVELRRELQERHGRRFATRSDTEVILHAYAVWGDDCVRHFNGQWSFALWDRDRGRLFCSRDRLGVRPFFHTVADGRFLFASEVKALFAVPGVSRALDLAGLKEVLTYWCTVAPRTPWQGVAELPPGCSLVVEDGRASVRRYWRLDFDEPEELLTGEEPSQLRALMEDAVRVRLRADVPVGAYVSGGIDSSVIAGLVKKSGIARMETFSLAFADPRFDERQFQREVTSALEADHREIAIGDDAVADVFPDVVWHAEAPLIRAAPAPMMLLARLVRSLGRKVVLTGEGADEILGGYDVFKEAKLRRFLAAQPTSQRRQLLLRRLYPYQGGMAAQSERMLRAFFEPRPGDLADPLFSHLPRWRTTRQLERLLADDVLAAVSSYEPMEELRATLPARFASFSPFAKAQYLEAAILLPGYILSSQGDRMAMAASVEGRFPFLDVSVVEWAARLPARGKMRGLQEKHILKRACGDLVPAAVLHRHKQPYRAPDAASFIDERTGRSRRPWIDDALSAERIRAVGVWHPAAVEKLVEKARAGKLTGVKDNMALTAVLSTQLLVERFIEGNGRGT